MDNLLRPNLFRKRVMALENVQILTVFFLKFFPFENYPYKSEVLNEKFEIKGLIERACARKFPA